MTNTVNQYVDTVDQRAYGGISVGAALIDGDCDNIGCLKQQFQLIQADQNKHY